MRAKREMENKILLILPHTFQQLKKKKKKKKKNDVNARGAPSSARVDVATIIGATEVAR
jgi:hypothetical protein|tara:strand:+ start:460 stop:636 length:177 start_codon:yes stop_codon:yes gene_type:complete